MTANALKAISSLHQSNSGLYEILETLAAAIYITDAEGRLTYFNAAAETLSGRKPKLGVDQWCVTWKIFLPDGSGHGGFAFLNFLPDWIWGIVNITVFFGKVVLLLVFFIWVRWTLPRFRFDQLMRIGWLYLFEIALATCTWTLDRLPPIDYSELMRDLEYARIGA